MNLLNLSDSKLKWLSFLVIGIIVASTMLLHGSFSGFLVMIAFSTTVQAPLIRSILLKADKRLAVICTISLLVFFAIYPWVHQTVSSLLFFFGTAPLFQHFRTVGLQKMGIKLPSVPKVKKEKAPGPTRDPNKPLTNTAKKWLARKKKKK